MLAFLVSYALISLLYIKYSLKTSGIISFVKEHIKVATCTLFILYISNIFNFKNNYRVCAKKCDLVTARIARF